MRRHNRKMPGDDLVEVSRDPRVGESSINGTRITRLPNGQIEVSDGEDGPRIPKEGDHDENLAEYLTDGQRQTIAQELLELYASDKESRADWEMREEVAVEMLGIQKQADHPDRSKKLEFPTSRGHEVTHPLMAEACTQFNARALAELFPPDGPVRVTTLGRRRTGDLNDQAERVQAFMNYYLTEVDREYFEDVDSMLFYLSLAGSAFKKVAVDVRTGLPVSRYVKAANFIVPYSARSLDGASRYHHRYSMVDVDIQKAVDIGYFLDQGIQIAGHMGLRNINKAEDRADYRTEVIARDDNVFDYVESHAYYKLPLKFGRSNRRDSNQVRPYVFYIDEENREITRISREWAQDDGSYRRKRGFVHYKFLPGLGFYGFGYPHVIGSLGRASSGAVNVLLDAGTASNFQGGFKTKSGRGLGDVELEHGVYKEVDADYEDLTKTFFNPPFKGPEPAMVQLLQGLVDAGRRFASIQDAQVGAGNNTGPVGTTVALIEEGSRVYTAIHKRLHKAARDEYSILADLIHDYMPERYPFEADGEERVLLRQDFDGRVDISPVSDPNIFSSTQRIAIAQNVIQLQSQAPQLYSRKQMVAAHRQMLQAMRSPDWEELAPEEQRPNYQDPVSENMLMLTGQAVKAFYHQLDEVHIQVHQNFLQIQQGMMEPQEFAQLQATMSAHIREHQAQAYRKQIEQQLGIPLPPINLDGEKNEDQPPELEAAISIAVVQRLLPPPPNPEEQQASQEVMDEKARKDFETQAKIERETASWEAKLRREEEDHKATLRRDEEKHAQELDQAEQRANLEDMQRRADLAAGIIRDNVSHAVDLNRKDAAGRLDLEHRSAKSRQELEHRGRTGNLALATTEAKGRQSLTHAERKAGVELSNRDRGAALERSHRDQAHQQQQRQSDEAGKQALEQRSNLAKTDMDNRNAQAAQQREQEGAMAKTKRMNTRHEGLQRRKQGEADHRQAASHKDQSQEQDIRSRERRQQLEEKIASKRALGAKRGANRRKAQKGQE